MHEKDKKKAGDDLKEQLAAKYAKLCELSKEFLSLEEAKNSLLDFLYF